MPTYRAALSASLVMLLGGWALPVPLPDGEGQRPSLRGAQGKLSLLYEHSGNQLFRQQGEGQSWLPAVALGRGSSPALECDCDGALERVWVEQEDVLFSSSGDGGKSWSRPLNLSRSSATSRQPALAVGRDHSVAVAWVEHLPGNTPEIYFCSSRDSGRSFGRPINLSHTPGISSQPTVALSASGQAYVAWLDTTSGSDRPDVFYTCGGDQGWSQPVNLSNTAGISDSPNIAVQGNHIYVVWSDTSRTGQISDIYLSQSSDGVRFTQPIYFDTPGNSTQPQVAADERERVVVAWADGSESSDNPDIYLSHSSDAGKTFSRAENFSRSPQPSSHPSLFLDDAIQLAWEEGERIHLASLAFPRKARQPISGGKY